MIFMGVNKAIAMILKTIFTLRYTTEAQMDG